MQYISDRDYGCFLPDFMTQNTSSACSNMTSTHMHTQTDRQTDSLTDLETLLENIKTLQFNESSTVHIRLIYHHHHHHHHLHHHHHHYKVNQLDA